MYLVHVLGGHVRAQPDRQNDLTQPQQVLSLQLHYGFAAFEFDDVGDARVADAQHGSRGDEHVRRREHPHRHASSVHWVGSGRVGLGLAHAAHYV